MMKAVNEILAAQDFLKGKYGEEGYQKIMQSLKNRVKKYIDRDCSKKLTEWDVYLFMTKDENLPAVARLVACAALGE